MIPRTAQARASISVRGPGCDWGDQCVVADRRAAEEQQCDPAVVLRPSKELSAICIWNISAMSEQQRPDLSVIPGNVRKCRHAAEPAQQHACAVVPCSHLDLQEHICEP